MTNLRTNLDTYRVIAETLELLRSLTRTVLERDYGNAWEAQAIPEPMRSFLEQRRDREATIQWRLPDSHDLLDFAGFENLSEIILACEPLAQAFATVSRDCDLLRARFLELDAIQNRIAYVRPVSDIELEFVVSFSERLRRVAVPSVRSDAPRPAAAGRAPAAPPATPLQEAVEVSDPAEPAAAAGTGATVGQAPSGGTVTAAPASDAERTPVVPHVGTKELEKALSDGHDDQILAALYAEVTKVAEALWSETAALSTPAWDRVREASWYEKSFSKLGLKPLSDFYDLHRQVGRRLADGASRTDVQEMLQERRFGEVLMALRELFRKHLVR